LVFDPGKIWIYEKRSRARRGFSEAADVSDEVSVDDEEEVWWWEGMCSSLSISRARSGVWVRDARPIWIFMARQARRMEGTGG